VGAGLEPSKPATQAAALKSYRQTELYSDEAGFFFDSWSAREPARQHYCFEGFWPLICGAATPAQANRLIDESLLNPERFLTRHPVPMVSVSDPLHELRMMRGPAWNSLTFWLARGCRRYGRADAAARILELALDATAEQFQRTGTVWEFYHPQRGEQTELQRKPETPFNAPCCEYLGHNPLFAMARLWQECTRAAQPA